MADDKSSKTAKWLIGCTIGIVVMGIVCAGLAWWGYGAAKEFGIEFVHEKLVVAVEKSGLPPAQVDSMKVDLDRAKMAAEEGRLDYAKLEGLEQSLEKIVAMGVVKWFETGVVGDPELAFDDAERADAQLTMQRYACGVQNDQINPSEASARIQVQIDDDGEVRRWDPEDVRAVVAKCKRDLEGSGVPEEPCEVDVASEFSSLVDGLIVD